MKHTSLQHFAFSCLLGIVGLAAGLPAVAQDRIYRCGNEYINNVRDAESRGCKLVEGGNITVVQGTKPQGTSNSASQAPVRVAAAGQKVDGTEQRARDSDSRAILESELAKAKARQAELQSEYNNGEPDKRGDEARNYQKYIDRVAELKASMSRNDSDIAGIQREIARLPASK